MDFENSMQSLVDELHELEQQLSTPDVINDQARYRDLSVRHAELMPVINCFREFQAAAAEEADAQAMLADTDDGEMREFLEETIREAHEKRQALEKELFRMLLPVDPLDEKNAIVEVRAGTGGDEAALFAGDLLSMYSRFAELRGWKVALVSATEGEMGGYKEAILEIKGRNAYGTLRHESGIHRVQRVPATESQGRIHTSAATVAVLPEVEHVDVEIDPGDLQIEAFRAGGPGGQHMQKNETAVRITHKPTGFSVACSDQRSQMQNRERAMALLRTKLYEMQMREQAEKMAQERKELVKSGDRSEKIRTYNFPQDRLTDHRIGFTTHNLPQIFAGEIEELIKALQDAEYQTRLEALEG